MGDAPRIAQEGGMDTDAKVLQCFGGAGSLEGAERFERNAYRDGGIDRLAAPDLNTFGLDVEINVKPKPTY